MKKPRNKRKEARNYKIAYALIGLGILFIALHMGQVANENIILAFISGLEHMEQEPLGIFPISKEYLPFAFYMYVICVCLLHVNYLRNRDTRPGEETGSAKWNDNLKKYYKKYAELKKPVFLQVFYDKVINPLYKKRFVSVLAKILDGLCSSFSFSAKVDQTPGVGNMILSDEVFLSMNTRKTRRNNNQAVHGGSGAGKSRFYIKPNILQADCSFVVTDPSGELLETTGKFLEEQGYEIKVFNLQQMEYSNRYNPFKYIRDQKGVLSMVNVLMENTTVKGASKGDPFWDDSVKALLQALSFYLISECNEDEQNFSSVMRLLRCAEVKEDQGDFESTLDILFRKLKEREPEHIAVQTYAIFKQAAGKTAQSILVSTSVRLQTFNLEDIARLTNTDDIDLKSIGDKKTALFCITPVSDSTYNYLVAMLYTQLFETLYYHAEVECEGKRLSHHVRFLLDEFANVGTIPEFAQKVSTMRKYEISVTIVLQALSQLKALYEKEWDVILGNCDEQIFLGGNDQTTTKYISEKIGKETIKVRNSSRSYGSHGSSSLSYNTQARDLITPDELTNMDNENCVVFIRGEDPFFSKKYDYERHPNYKYTGDADKRNNLFVKDFFTEKPAEKKSAMEIPTGKQIKVMAERTDTFYADRQIRRQQLGLAKQSAKGQPTYTPMDMRKAYESISGKECTGEETKEEIRGAFEQRLNLLEVHDSSDYDPYAQYDTEEEQERS